MDTETLKELLHEGLTLAMNQATEDNLGDRTEYVGASDASGCIRKAVLGKRNPKGMNTLAAKIRAQRGHMAEEIFTSGYAAIGKTFSYQLELIPAGFPAPCRIHPDIVLDEGSYLEIQEIKTTEGLPTNPYDSWVRQNNLQIGTLKQQNPDRPVKGTVVAMDLNTGQIKAYPQEFDAQLFEFMKTRVGLIWRLFQENAPDPLPTEKGPLCGWCGYAGDCPALQLPDGLLDLPIEEQLQLILELREVTNSGDRQLKIASSMVQAIMEEQNVKVARAGGMVVKRLLRSKKDLNKGLLMEEQPGIYETYKKTTSYYVLDISQV